MAFFMGKCARPVQVQTMNGDGSSDKMALLVAEEILRTIYGDDLTGCTVSLEQIAPIIHNAMQQRAAQDQRIVDTFEKVVESLHQLSTPPPPDKVSSPDQLRTLLGDRLDAIHAITAKTIDMAAKVKSERAGNKAP